MKEVTKALLVEEPKGFVVKLELILHCSADTVWEQFVSFKTWKEWSDEVLSVVAKPEIGTLVQINLNTKPAQKQQYRITDYQPLSKMVWQGGLFLPFLLKTVKSFTLTPDGASKCTFRVEERYTGYLQRYLKGRQTEICAQLEQWGNAFQENLPITLRGIIRHRKGVNKVGEPTDSDNYFLETADTSYFINVFHRALSPLDLVLLKDTAVEVQAILKEGLWDTDNPEVQSRTGPYLELKTLDKR
jgi:hypothetical protein